MNDKTKNKTKLKPGTLLAPLPVALVSCGSMEQPNLITVAWTGICCSAPPMTYVSIKPQRFSHDLIAQSGSFAINLVNRSLAWATDWCGVKSGRDFNKFEEMHLTAVPSDALCCPMVAESPLSLECKVVQTLPLGSHDMFLAEIVGVYADAALMDENGRLMLDRADLVSYSHGEYFSLGDKLGSFGHSVMKEKTKRRKGLL